MLLIDFDDFYFLLACVNNGEAQHVGAGVNAENAGLLLFHEGEIKGHCAH